jgi:hypothetical protein
VREGLGKFARCQPVCGSISWAYGSSGLASAGSFPRGAEVAAGLAAPDDVQYAVQYERVPFGILVGVDGRPEPQEGVAGGYLPVGLQQPGQRLGGWRLVEVQSVE